MACVDMQEVTDSSSIVPTLFLATRLDIHKYLAVRHNCSYVEGLWLNIEVLGLILVKVDRLLCSPLRRLNFRLGIIEHPSNLYDGITCDLLLGSLVEQLHLVQDSIHAIPFGSGYQRTLPRRDMGIYHAKAYCNLISTRKNGSSDYSRIAKYGC